jgi:hypothetical protein
MQRTRLSTIQVLLKMSPRLQGRFFDGPALSFGAQGFLLTVSRTGFAIFAPKVRDTPMEQSLLEWRLLYPVSQVNECAIAGDAGVVNVGRLINTAHSIRREFRFSIRSLC